MDTKKIKQSLWLILFFMYFSGIGRTIVALPFSVINVLSNNSTTLSPNIIELTHIIYRIIEASFFVFIIRKETFSEFKSEKIDKKVLLFVLLTFFYAACFYTITNQPQTQFTYMHYIRTIIFAPIFEELMFRGALLKTLDKFGGAKFSIICSAFMFSVFHLEPVQILFTLPLGVLLGYIAKNYSIKHSILTHIGVNLISLIYSFNTNIVTLFAIIGVIYIIFVIILKRKQIINFILLKSEKQSYKKFFFNIPMILIIVTLALFLIGKLA